MNRFFPLMLLALVCARAPADITVDSAGFPHVALETTVAPGEQLLPQVSLDLQNWQPLAPRAVEPDGRIRFTDFGGSGQVRRFYRAIALPGPGTYVFYERLSADGTHSVFRCRLDGTGETCLASGQYPRPSYNGRWVLVTRDGTGPSNHTGADIWIVDMQSPDPEECGYAARLLFNNPTEDLISYSFEHDNDHFVFDCGGRLYRMTTNGGVRQAFFPNADCVEAMPSFSPIDSTLAYAHRVPSQLATRQVGAAKQVLTPAGQGDSWPQWSPDGAWITACDGNTDLSRTDLGHDLIIVDAASRTRQPLTQLSEPGDGFPFGGVWSANSLFVYAAGTVNGQRGIWRIPAGGGAPQPFAIASPYDGAPGVSLAPVVFVGGVVQ